MKWRALLCTISLLFSVPSFAQLFRPLGWRIGIDPLRSASIFLHDPKHKYSYFPNTLEAYSEFIFLEKTSIVLEPGYGKAFFRIPSGNLLYNSQGYYLKAGIDFKISGPEDRFEITLGWRVGMNNYSESAKIDLLNSYYGEHYTQDLPVNHKQFMWGEFLLTHKYCFWMDPKQKNRLYFAFSLRMKVSNRLPGEGYSSLIIPGYGFYKKAVPGISFGLIYHFGKQRSSVKEMKLNAFHHARHNNHHYSVKRGH